jgi:formiminotetrahydrofolate cyclodeaminase
LTQAIADDSKAFEAVMDAYRLPDSDSARDEAIQRALYHAAEVPLNTARLAVEALEQLQIVASQGNINAATDAAAGAHLAQAALEAAVLNVLVNLQDLSDEAAIQAFSEQVAVLRDAGRALSSGVVTTATDRIGLG